MTLHLAHWTYDPSLLALLIDADQVHHLSIVELSALTAGIAEAHSPYVGHITKYIIDDRSQLTIIMWRFALLRPIATFGTQAPLWRKKTTWYFVGPVSLASSLAYARYFHFNKHTKEESVSQSQCTVLPQSGDLSFVDRLRYLTRFLELSLIFMPPLIALPLYLFRGTRQYWLSLLLWAVKRAGIVWIKAFQYLSHRGDIIGEEMAQKFSVLRENAPSHAFEATQSTIKRVYGKSISEMFEDFEPQPIASGSVSQVYKAKFDGKQVAVKVRHPLAGKNLERDIDLLFGFSKFFSLFSRKLELPVTQDSFKRILRQQLCFLHEKRNLDRFNKFTVDKDIRFPTAYPESTEEVLIEQYINGESIGFYEQHTHVLNRVIANIGAKAFFSMLMKYNFTHADCHAGNIMVKLQPVSDELTEIVGGTISKVSNFLLSQLIKVGFDSAFLRKLVEENYEYEKSVQDIIDLSKQRVEIILIDVGMVINLSRQKKESFQKFLEEMIKGDPIKCAKWVYDFSSSRQGQLLEAGEHEEYRKDLETMFRRVHLKDLSSLQGITVLKEMLGVIRDHGMKLDGDISILLTNMLILQAIAKDLDPSINILRCAVPYLHYA